MFFVRARKIVLAVVTTLGLTVLSACGTGASDQAQADCGALPASEASYNIRNLGLFFKRNVPIMQVTGDITNIPDGYTVWTLLRNDRGQCYMHTMSGPTPVNGGRLALGDSIVKSDMAQMGAGDVHYVLLVADPDDSRELEKFTHDGTPAADRLVTYFGNRTAVVNRDQIDVTMF